MCISNGLVGYLVKRVAAQVHDDTIALAIKPVLTERFAVMNISDVCTSWRYRLRSQVIPSISKVNNAPNLRMKDNTVGTM